MKTIKLFYSYIILYAIIIFCFCSSIFLCRGTSYNYNEAWTFTNKYTSFSIVLPIQ